ncbi:membrane integrity-associated transporter subunit PqiC [Stakelama sp. CBK3Z-3]|uniref:Membrane integrity-associated transporter subunit PqiC n=1 Tax=Stakelama flava TaxID=2860338 RepID=A0ABS6XIL4_9SPHN|nr:ABC-type transport auxiliary lipoprotein family protein [Stakelama flava]MBW4330053.1 membrane integrity-associated transporter subunit PqiC [Stakelama flava]
MKTLPAIAAAALLAGCVSFGSKPPPSLLVLDSSAAVTVGDTQSSATSPTIAVATPLASQEIAVQRVPVRSSDTSIAYVKDAQWVEPPANLFARLLGDTIAARTGRVVLGGQAAINPGAMLAGNLRNFTIDAATMEAVVTYDASLIRGDTQTVETRRFEARVPVSAIASDSVGPALNQAANQVATQVADWVGR